jgi:3D (Asp-Asp-Asp) domain-containing protein
VEQVIETLTARRIRTRLTLAGTAAVAFLLGMLTLMAVLPAGREPVELMSVQAIGDASEPAIQNVAFTDIATEEIAIDVMPDESPAVAAPRASKKPAPVSFDGRPLRKARTMEMVVTGYSPDARSCGASADGITASGYSVWTNGMKMVAADTRVLPMKSVITIPGYNNGKPVPVLDRGGAIKGNRLDLLFPTHEQARQWGKKKLTITVWAYAD